jgi:hypothetical protein
MGSSDGYDEWTQWSDAYMGVPSNVIIEGKTQIVTSDEERLLVTSIPWEHRIYGYIEML